MHLRLLCTRALLCTCAYCAPVLVVEQGAQRACPPPWGHSLRRKRDSRQAAAHVKREGAGAGWGPQGPKVWVPSTELEKDICRGVAGGSGQPSSLASWL